MEATETLRHRYSFGQKTTVKKSKEMSNQTILSAKTGWVRWKALFESRAREERIEVRLDTPTPKIHGTSATHQAWHLEVLSQMATPK